MAWGRRRRWRRWRRRRKPWWRRWRRRRRRRRRPYRRRRPRRVRRRRRGWARAYRRWNRRRGRRGRKKKLVLTQWQPAVRKRCLIVGYDPLIICGQNLTSRNFSSHIDEFTFNNQAYGGGFCTHRYSLRTLFDDFLTHHNFWTASNKDLDLTRYHGVTIIFFRHPTTDFIARIRTSPPFEDTDSTAMTLHPGMLALAKKRILIPSLKTRPSRKHYIKIKVGAPKLFEDKWYPQSQLCDTTLLTIQATVADLQFPFGSPLTNSICCNFQILDSNYEEVLSVLNTTEIMNKRDEVYKKLLNIITMYNTTQTIAQLGKFMPTTNRTELASNNATNTTIEVNKYENGTKTNNFSNWSNTTPHNNTLYAGSTYTTNKGTSTSTQNKIPPDQMKEANLAYVQAAQVNLPNWRPSPYGTSKDKPYPFEYYTGMYSSIFLGSGRANWEITGSYRDISYNPLADKGIGNMIWLDVITKNTQEYEEGKSKCMMANYPLWAMLYGYFDFCDKVLDHVNIDYEYRLLIKSPYTHPMMTKHDRPLWGFVVYSENFGKGRMPGGNPVPPLWERVHWYPSVIHQKEVAEAICQTGPFAYHSDEHKTVLTIKYKFRWTWGGNPIFQQVVRDPCKQQTRPNPSRQPRELQIADPKYQTPEVIWHAWDWRRGLFSQKSIKRVSEQPLYDEFSTDRSKRPRKDTGVSQEQEQKESSSIPQRVLQPWIDSSQASQTEQESEQEEESLQEKLKKQLLEQRLLGDQLRLVCQQISSLQAGHGLHPLLQSRV
nr:MAG: ORF1 [Torque teno virus]